MIYLQPSEYETYALEKSTPAALVAAASSLIEAHCRRPTLGVAQYVERVRLRPGRNSLRLTYLPLAAVAPALSPFVAVKARYAVPRRGEGEDCSLAYDIATAFGLPGAWNTLDASALDYDVATGELALSCGLTCKPHSFVVSLLSHHQRPARKSSPRLIARVQGAQPMLGMNSSCSGL